MDFHRGLPVRSGRVHLALLYRDGRVAVDDLVEHAAQRFNAEGQRGDIEQQQIFDLAAEHTGLHGRADGYALVGVDAFERLLADEIFHRFLNRRDTRRTADQQDLVDLIRLKTCVVERLAQRNHRFFHQIGCQFVKLGARKRYVEVLRAGRIGCDIGKVDVRAHHTGQLDFRLLRSFLQTLHRRFVVPQVDAVFLLEGIDHPVHNLLVEVVAAETVVACCCQYLKYAV